MPYPHTATECSACGRTRDPLIVPPPIVDAARIETYRRAVPPSLLKVTVNDTVTIIAAFAIALIITMLRLFLHLW